MRVIHGREAHIPRLTRPKVTLGTFDGVHLGHQRVLERTVNWAHSTDAVAVAVTFDRRPRQTLAGVGPDHITSLRHRLLLLERLGVDLVLVLAFDRALASCEPEAFIREILLDTLGAGGVLLGHDTRFGHGGRGDLDLMQAAGHKFNFEVRAVPVVDLDGRPVSSTRVRMAITAGDLALAERLLGRQVSTLGTVVGGTGRGREVGVPTANLDLHHEVRLPEGVYATRAGFGGRWYDSVTNIGRPPSLSANGRPFLSDEIVTEAYVLDFSGDLYGKDIEVRFLRRLRPERRFDSPAALARAIADDVAAARAFHAADNVSVEPIV